MMARPGAVAWAAGGRFKEGVHDSQSVCKVDVEEMFSFRVALGEAVPSCLPMLELTSAPITIS